MPSSVLFWNVSVTRYITSLIPYVYNTNVCMCNKVVIDQKKKKLKKKETIRKKLRQKLFPGRKFSTCYYAQMWRLRACTNKTNNISMLDLPASRKV